MARYRRGTNGAFGWFVSRRVAGAISGPYGGSAYAIDSSGPVARCAANARIRATLSAG